MFPKGKICGWIKVFIMQQVNINMNEISSKNIILNKKKLYKSLWKSCHVCMHVWWAHNKKVHSNFAHNSLLYYVEEFSV